MSAFFFSFFTEDTVLRFDVRPEFEDLWSLLMTHQRQSAQKQIRHNSHTQTAVAYVKNANFAADLETNSLLL